MKQKKNCFAKGFLFIIFLLCLTIPFPVHGTFLYKTYFVRHDRGNDILCDPYIVQKDDYVLKLFRQMGEISQKDFPKFLSIFKRINPDVRDINLVRPGQHVLIPLKKIKHDSLPGQSSGIVTIPFITISNIDEIIKTHSKEYEIQKGDYVSKLISRYYGAYGTKEYEEGLKLFKVINPDILDINLIYPGQKICFADTNIRNQPWYESLFNSSLVSNPPVNSQGAGKIEKEKNAQISPTEKVFEAYALKDTINKPRSPIEEIAFILEGKLVNKGTYCFPGKGQKDYRLNLSKTPFIELDNGGRILFSSKEDLLDIDRTIVKSFWKHVKIVPIPHEASLRQVFNSIFVPVENNALKDRLSFLDHGVEVKINGEWFIEKSDPDKTDCRICVTIIENLAERTPDSIFRYLKKHGIIIKEILKDNSNNKIAEQRPDKVKEPKTVEDIIKIAPLEKETFTKNFLSAMGCNYAQKVSISFPYAGTQVDAVSNLISKGDGKTLLVDFGDLYGEAASAIEKTGLEIIQIKRDDNFNDIVQKLLGGLNVSYTNDPIFYAADRPVVHNISLKVPGFLAIHDGKPEIMFATVPIDNNVAQFLCDKGIKVIRIVPAS